MILSISVQLYIHLLLLHSYTLYLFISPPFISSTLYVLSSLQLFRRSSPYSLEVDLLYILASMVDKGHYKMSVLANNLRQVKDTQASFDADERPTYFVVPHIGTCLSHQVNKVHAAKHIISILDLIAPHPFFSRNGGSDHVMLFMQDTGVCWFDNYNRLSNRVRPFVHVTNLGIDIDRYRYGFWVWDDVCFGGKRGIPVPQVRKPDFPKVAPGKLSPHQAVWPRPYLLTFRGTIRTIEEPRYSHNTRQILFQERRRLDGSEQWVATGKIFFSFLLYLLLLLCILYSVFCTTTTLASILYPHSPPTTGNSFFFVFCFFSHTT